MLGYILYAVAQRRGDATIFAAIWRQSKARIQLIGSIAPLRDDLFKIVLRRMMAPHASMLRHMLANAMFILLVARELVLTGGLDE